MDVVSSALADPRPPREPADPGGLASAYRHLRALEHDGADAGRILRAAMDTVLPGRIAAVSSFGTESVLLLSMIAEIDPSLPVVFLDTGKHFPETLAYRDELAQRLGLRDVRDVAPSAASLTERDPSGALWHFDPDACCALRKVEPLERALRGFDGWISGRKRHQAATRAAMTVVEFDGTPHQAEPARRLGRRPDPGRDGPPPPAAAPAGRARLSFRRLLRLHPRRRRAGPRPVRPLGRPGQGGMRHPPRHGHRLSARVAGRRSCW